MASSPITSWQIDGETVRDFICSNFGAPPNSDCSHEIKTLVMTNRDSILKSRDITSPAKVCLVKAVAFPVVMHGCESWTIKKAEQWRIYALNCGVGKDSWESLCCKEIQAVHPKGNQSWIFIGRTDAEGKLQTLATWCKELTHWERLKAEEKGTTDHEMVGWHHLLNGQNVSKL